MKDLAGKPDLVVRRPAQLGWRHLVVWECQIADIEKLQTKVEELLTGIGLLTVPANRTMLVQAAGIGLCGLRANVETVLANEWRKLQHGLCPHKIAIAGDAS